MGITKFATYSCARSYSTCISSGRWSVLIVHGEKAHSCYFSRDAYAAMTAESKYTDNKELMIIPDAVHTDLYDNVDVIPFDKLQSFFEKYL
ncbi:alpha/beta hydrolase [Ruminococcus sp. 5_1_39BFAA]|uniref:alpha/beta hydrolase n=1 Tax=Ruminococcus sp. 5_1_39BFAA TaxID=457412 RepID=UPI0035685BB6